MRRAGLLAKFMHNRRLVPPFTIPAGSDEASPCTAGWRPQGLLQDEGPAPLIHLDLCMGRNPPLAMRACRFPVWSPGLSPAGSGMVGVVPLLLVFGPRARTGLGATPPPLSAHHEGHVCSEASQLPGSGASSCPGPGQVCVAWGRQIAGQAKRHL